MQRVGACLGPPESTREDVHTAGQQDSDDDVAAATKRRRTVAVESKLVKLETLTRQEDPDAYKTTIFNQ
jgi:hypothetical protein